MTRVEREHIRDGEVAHTVDIRTDLAIEIDAEGRVLAVERTADAVRPRDLEDVIRELVYSEEDSGSLDLLTEAEHRAMDLTAQLANVLSGEIIADGPGRTGDVNEAVRAIHVLQRMVMGQAAARAYPDRYRLLGGHPPTGVPSG